MNIGMNMFHQLWKGVMVELTQKCLGDLACDSHLVWNHGAWNRIWHFLVPGNEAEGSLVLRHVDFWCAVFVLLC